MRKDTLFLAAGPDFENAVNAPQRPAWLCPAQFSYLSVSAIGRTLLMLTIQITPAKKGFK